MMNLFEIATISCRKHEDKKFHDFYLVDEYVRELFKISNNTIRERILFKDLLEISHQRVTSYINSYSDEVDEDLDYIIAREGYDEIADPDPDDMVYTPEGLMTYADLLDRFKNDAAFVKLWEKSHWDEFLLESEQYPDNKTKYTKRRESVLQKMPDDARQPFAMAETIEKIVLDLRETLRDYGYAVKRSDLEKNVYKVAGQEWEYCALPGDAWAFCPLDEWLTREGHTAVVDPPQRRWEVRLDETPKKPKKEKEDNDDFPRIPYKTATLIWDRLYKKNLIEGTSMDFGMLLDPTMKIKGHTPKPLTFKGGNPDYVRLCGYLIQISRIMGGWSKEKRPWTAFNSVFTNKFKTNPSATGELKNDRVVDIVMDNIIKEIEGGTLQ